MKTYNEENQNPQVWCFDFDGTLVDIRLRYTLIYTELVCSLGGKPIDRYWLLRRKGLTEIDVLQLSRISEALYGKYDLMREMKLESPTYLLHDRLFPYALQLLKYLRNIGNKVYIVTHRSNQLTFIGQIEYFRLSSFINSSVCTKDNSKVTRSHRNNLAMTNDLKDAALQKSRFLNGLQFDKRKIFFVGDSLSDIEAARISQVNSISIPTGLFDRSILAKKNPLYLFNSIKELYEKLLLGEINKRS